MKTKLMMAMVAAAMSFGASAATEIVDGIEWRYTVIGGEAKVMFCDSERPAIPLSTPGEITIPSTLGGCPVTSIGDYAVSGCSWLTSVTIPSSVTSIGDAAFRDCSGLESVTIPSSVTSIGDSAFSGCSGLESFSVALDNPSYASIGGMLCTKDGKSLIAGVNGDDVVIPSSVTSIGDYAFEECSGLKSVTIPSSVTSIGDYAFNGCSELKTVDFFGAPPSGVIDSGLLGCELKRYPMKYGSAWRSVLGTGLNEFYVAQPNKPVVKVVSSGIRENDPTVMDVVYKVMSTKPTVKIRVLAFEDGERSFAKVVRPETFVDGTGVNVGDNITPNVEHKISWRVSGDWQTKLAKVKFEVMASDGELLPLETMTIPASDQYGKMKITWNAILDTQAFDALLWLYADKDTGLSLSNGQLKNGTTLLADGMSMTVVNAMSYIYSKMGYSLLTGAPLTYANQETRLGLSPSGARQYGYKIVE